MIGELFASLTEFYPVTECVLVEQLFSRHSRCYDSNNGTKKVRPGESGCRKVGEGLAGFRMSVCRGHDKRYVLAQLSSQFMVVL